MMTRFPKNLFDLAAIGECVKVKRIEKGISVRELARLCRLSPTTIQNVEAGGNVKIETVCTISRVLEIRIIADKNA